MEVMNMDHDEITNQPTCTATNVDAIPSTSGQGIDCEPSCFESCIDLSGSIDHFEEFEIVKSHEFEEWDQGVCCKGGDTASQSDFLALTMSSVAESLLASFKLSESDFEVIEIDCCQPESTETTSPSLGDLCDGILDRTLRDRQLELAELQNASCVTTGDARSSLSQFFNRYNQTENGNPAEGSVAPQTLERNVPTDVQSLMQQSIVTSTLSSRPFRELLERTLGSRAPAPPQQRQLPAQRSSRERPRFQRQNQAPQQNRESLRANLLSEIRNFQSRGPRSLPADLIGQIRTQENLRSTSDHAQTTRGASDAAQLANSSHQIHRLQAQLEQGVALLRQTINQDLHHLHQYSVVTSILNGQFRTQLEDLVQRGVDRVGNGAAVQDFIRSLARSTSSNLPRQNSSHRSRGADDDLYTELRSLKVQVDEMRRVMQMNVEVQLDVQRAIRQEVAAVMGAVRQHITSQLQQAAQQTVLDSGAGSLSSLLSPVAEFPSRNHQTAAAGSCAICLDRAVDAVFYQCGHMCVCIQCGLQLKADGHNCPVCRATIQDVIRAYQNQI